MSIEDVQPGGFTVRQRLLSSVMNAIRSALLKAVDGVGGGTYTPSATISISDLTVGGGNRLKYSSRTVTRVPVNLLAGWTSDDTRWARNTASSRPYWYQPNYGNARLWFQLNLPAGSVLDSVTMQIIGTGHSGVPNTPVGFLVKRGALNSVSTTTIGTGTDSPGSAGAYDSLHSVTASGIAHTVDATQMYWLDINGESGANEANGTRIFSITASVTMTAQDEWGTG